MALKRGYYNNYRVEQRMEVNGVKMVVNGISDVRAFCDYHFETVVKDTGYPSMTEQGNPILVGQEHIMLIKNGSKLTSIHPELVNGMRISKEVFEIAKGRMIQAKRNRVREDEKKKKEKEEKSKMKQRNEAKQKEKEEESKMTQNDNKMKKKKKKRKKKKKEQFKNRPLQGLRDTMTEVMREISVKEFITRKFQHFHAYRDKPIILNTISSISKIVVSAKEAWSYNIRKGMNEIYAFSARIIGID